MAKYLHNFRVSLDSTNYEGAVGACVGRQSGEYVVAKSRRIAFHDAKTLDEKYAFEVDQGENYLKQK